MEHLPESHHRRLADNLARIREKMERALASAGRPPESCRLLAVTKGVTPSHIQSLLELGVQDMGENRPEVLQKRRWALGPDARKLRWHMIGHYQRRKVRDSALLLSVVHSAHSDRLLDALQKARSGHSPHLEIYLQVNPSGEATKQGLSTAEVRAILDRRSEWPDLKIGGLMSMAPFGASEDDLRRVFRQTRALKDELRDAGRGIEELSMGMSGDFEIAIQEGATIVRVGSLLFDGVI